MPTVWDEVKTELGEGPEYVSRAQFRSVFGYAGGKVVGTFATDWEAQKAGASKVEHVCDEEAFKAARDAYNAHQSVLTTEWKRRVRAQHPEVNDAVFEIVYSKAYDDGHAGGYGEVESYISDYVDFAVSIVAAANS